MSPAVGSGLPRSAGAAGPDFFAPPSSSRLAPSLLPHPLALSSSHCTSHWFTSTSRSRDTTPSAQRLTHRGVSPPDVVVVGWGHPQGGIIGSGRRSCAVIRDEEGAPTVMRRQRRPSSFPTAAGGAHHAGGAAPPNQPRLGACHHQPPSRRRRRGVARPTSQGRWLALVLVLVLGGATAQQPPLINPYSPGARPCDSVRRGRPNKPRFLQSPDQACPAPPPVVVRRGGSAGR